MSDDQKGTIRAASDGGISGEHDSPQPFEFLVGPTTTDQFNTARLRLIPIACWRVDDIRFAFDSSFVDADSSTDPDSTPSDIRTELQDLAGLVKDHQGCPLSVFGHADPVGNDDYNKLLSGRRAMAVYALLIVNTDPGTAVKMWQYISGKEKWGSNQQDTMRALTGLSVGTQDSELMKAYMQKLCPAELKLSKTDFLAQGADSGGKGDFQGCSEFNPVLLFSKEDQARFDQAAKGDRSKPEIQAVIAERNAANAPNRRVMVLLFRKGSRIDTAKWPCPTATGGIAGCKKRFWSDGEKRRSTHSPGADRSFEATQDTYACRFYQRVSDGSPCSAILPPPVITGINATLPATKAFRDPNNKSRPDNVLTPSILSDESLQTNKPVILVRGCSDIQLQAVTVPPNMPVKWFVKPNENDQDAPTITPTDGGKTAKLKTDKTGSFSVIAAVGITKIVWNVVFVWVKVDPATSVKITRDLYVDAGSTATFASFRSGEFVLGKLTWEASVKVKLIGGGKDKTLGIDQIGLGVLQNGVADTLTGHYDKGGTCLEVPRGGTPITDSNGNADTQPLLTNKISVSVTPDNKSAARTVWTADSPTGAFSVKHTDNKEKLKTISGINGFETAVASRSKIAPTAFCVHAKMAWEANFSGDISYSLLFAVSSYKANGAATKSKPQFTLISEATGGADAQQAGFETFEPRFNNGTDKKFTP